MKEACISGKHPHRKHGNYKKVSKELITDNLLMHNFVAFSRNEIWSGDITYIPTKEGFLYLMVFMDVYGSKIVSWSMAEYMTGNVHDSKNVEHILKQVTDRFDDVTAASADAGYITPFIARLLFKKGIRPILPYKRPQTKKGFFKKYEYEYDEYLDIYNCPNHKELTYETTDHQG